MRDVVATSSSSFVRRRRYDKQHVECSYLLRMKAKKTNRAVDLPNEAASGYDVCLRISSAV